MRAQPVGASLRLAGWALRALGATWRPDARGGPAAISGRLWVGWHASFLAAAHGLRDRELVVCVSRSRDGERIAGVLRELGYAPPVRGSSSRSGTSALRQLLRRLDAGESVGLLVDGPRGPARRAKLGAVSLAPLARDPITPVGIAAWPARRARSWDRALLPLPFARVAWVAGDPIPVPPEADEAEQERIRARLERVLDALTCAAGRSLGGRTGGTPRAAQASLAGTRRRGEMA
jgi:lysophospholipid acyltransferase (LPLAT)-like uncharacterized protein